MIPYPKSMQSLTGRLRYHPPNHGTWLNGSEFREGGMTINTSKLKVLNQKIAIFLSAKMGRASTAMIISPILVALFLLMTALSLMLPEVITALDLLSLFYLKCENADT